MAVSSMALVAFSIPSVAFIGLEVLRNDNFFYIWNVAETVDEKIYVEVQYAILSNSGTIVRAKDILDNTSASEAESTRDVRVRAAVGTNGNIGLIWTRTKVIGNTSNSNIYFAILSEGGNLIKAPTNVTNNSAYFSGTELNVPTYSSPAIAATADGNFVISWVDEQIKTGSLLQSNLKVAVFNTLGGVESAITTLRTGTLGGDRHDRPSLHRYFGNQVLLAYSLLDPSNGSRSLLYEELDSDGTSSSGQVALGTSGSDADGVLVTDSTFLLAWLNTVSEKIEYQIINEGVRGNRAVVELSTPDSRDATSVSVTSYELSGSYFGILSWLDSDEQKQFYYALIDDIGEIVTPVQIGQGGFLENSELIASVTGQGISPLSYLYSDSATLYTIYTPIIIR